MSASKVPSSSVTSPNFKPLFPCIYITLARFRRLRRTTIFQGLAITALVWISLLVSFQPRHPENDVQLENKIEENAIITVKSTTTLEPKRIHKYGEAVLVPPNDLAPGELGMPFVLPKNLTAEQKKLMETGWKNNAFNQLASDLISVRRSLPDYRDDWCESNKNYKISDLPVTSIIFIFHNEAWSVLLRSVHSVLNRSPPELIGEIILVDDFSDMDHLKDQLEHYMSSYPKVKIIRAKQRVGLIKARLMGAAVAKGPVLTFLDSHIEATTGWLEPLLERIARNRSTVVCPIIDVIDDDTFEFRSGGTTANSVGGFDWNMAFSWHTISERERKRHKHNAEPVYSPTMAGGLFSIDRDYFEELGAYDSGFDIWGAENLELSFKIWMCGGTLEIVSCSHVGHIFRKRSPYKWREGVNVVKHNAVRLAKVWLDDFAEYFYQRIGHDLGEYGDISSRIKLRESLHCKDFKWYLMNVYPEQFIPGEALGQGEIRNEGLGKKFCLDSPANRNEINKKAKLYPCHGQGGNQYWSFSKTGEIRRDEICLDAGGKDVIMFPCQGNPSQQWVYDQYTRLLIHKVAKTCLALETSKTVRLETCNKNKPKQRWRFQHFNANVTLLVDQ